MTTRTKLLILASGLAAVLALSLVSYWKGRKVGSATTNLAHVTKEIEQLEETKLEISHEVHAIDTNALRTRILALSERNREQALASK